MKLSPTRATTQYDPLIAPHLVFTDRAAFLMDFLTYVVQASSRIALPAQKRPGGDVQLGLSRSTDGIGVT